MKINRNQFLAVVYADLFDYPLTLKETKLWAISGMDGEGRLGKVDGRDGYYFLQGRQKIVELRRKREKAANGKAERAMMVAGVLAKIPTVEAVFLTGSVAAGNAKENADIDLMVVTKPGTLWMTRGAIVTLLRKKGWYRRGKDFSDRVCSNIFLGADHLEIRDRNLYTAHEILLARCLFDRGGVERKWLAKNGWVKGFLPKVYDSKMCNGQSLMGNQWQNNKKFKSRISHLLQIAHCLLLILAPLELFVFVLQYLYMKPKMTREEAGWGYAFFHPRDLSLKTMSKFGKKLRDLGVAVRV